jgi:2-dehydropantoate 2-reductase
MRYVILGAGAIGGLVGARLHQSGHDAILIARGDNYTAIAADGLRLRTPSQDVQIDVPVAPSAAAAGLRAGDVILLCTKSQDTYDALLDVRAALPRRDDHTQPRPSLPIVCVQNGVENERLAQRLFPDVYAAVILIPAEHLVPGEVISYGDKLDGRIDVGRYPEGTDALTEEVCAALASSHLDSEPRADIMVHKYAKLINNLFNAVDGICGSVDREANVELSELVQAEGRRVLRAAGIECEVEDIREVGERWARIGMGEVDGHKHRGSSTWQSVARGTGSVETDYLTGEIVLIARRHGLAAPLNELLQDLAARTISERRKPGWVSPSELLGFARSLPGN